MSDALQVVMIAESGNEARGCPSAAAIVAETERIRGGSLPAIDEHFEVTYSRDHGAFVAELRSPRSPDARRYQDVRCERLATAIATSIALALDDLAEQPFEPRRKVTRPAPKPATTDESELSPRPREVKRVPVARRSFALFNGLSAVIPIGWSDPLPPGVDVTVRAEFGSRWAVDFGTRWIPTRTGDIASGGAFETTLLLARAGGCYEWIAGTFGFDACGRLAAGSIRFAGRNLPETTQSRARPWAAAGAAVQGRWPFDAKVRAWVGVDVWVPFARDELTVQNRGTLHRFDPFWPSAEIGVEVRLR